MTTEQYGQFTVYNSWLQIISLITTFRLNSAVFNKGMSLFKDDRGSYISTMQIVTCTLTILTLIVYLFFKDYFNALIELPTIIVISIFVELLFSPSIDFWTIRKRFEYSYKPVVTRTLIMTALNAIIGILAVFYSDEKGFARILSCVFINVAFGIYFFCFNAKDSKHYFKLSYAKFALSFNLPLMLHYISQYILDQFDRIMIQKMVGLAAAGIYGVAYSIGLIMRIITTSVNNAFIPWQYERLDNKEYKELDDTMYSLFMLVALFSFVLSSFAPEIMLVLADKSYYEGIYIIPPVTLGLFFSFVYTFYANIEFYYSKNWFSTFISFCGAVLNIVLNYYGIKAYGYIAAAYTTLICYLLFSFGHYLYTKSILAKESGCYKLNSIRMLLLSIFLLLFEVGFIFIYDNRIIRYSIVLILVFFSYLYRLRIKNVLFSIKRT